LPGLHEDRLDLGICTITKACTTTGGYSTKDYCPVHLMIFNAAETIINGVPSRRIICLLNGKYDLTLWLEF
jgi:hypothetical protein